MADLTLALNYKSLSKTRATAVCVAWLIVEIMAIIMYYSSANIDGWMRLFLIVGGAALFAYPPFVIVSFYREGGVLTANQDGLIFPASMCGFGNTVSLKWKDLKLVDLHSNEKSEQTLLLCTNSGDVSKIAIKSVDAGEMEKLLLAMELWLPEQVWSTRAIAHRDGLQIGNSGDGSFTQFWESELRRRFSATTFVPHAPGEKIAEGLTVVKQLAFGGFSAVYQAENSNREKVVVKQLVVQNSDPEVQAKAVEQFDREAKILAKLDHPQIARVFDHFVSGGKTYMVMEFIEGENLRQFVKRKGAQSEPWVWHCAAQMAEILSYLHSRPGP